MKYLQTYIRIRRRENFIAFLHSAVMCIAN